MEAVSSSAWSLSYRECLRDLKFLCKMFTAWISGSALLKSLNTLKMIRTKESPSNPSTSSSAHSPTVFVALYLSAYDRFYEKCLFYLFYVWALKNLLAAQLTALQNQRVLVLRDSLSNLKLLHALSSGSTAIKSLKKTSQVEQEGRLQLSVQPPHLNNIWGIIDLNWSLYIMFVH